MTRRIVALIFAGAVLSSCQIQDASTHAVAGFESFRIGEQQQSVATPIPLPFDNMFPNRWNSSNNGSPYEPCVAFSDRELERFEIDPDSLEDAALVDGQGTRGCNWLMPDRFSFGQVVTNSQSLDEYKNGTSEYEWMSELEIQGRTVGQFTLSIEDSGTCSTYVQSGAAGVVTNVVTSKADAGRAMDACTVVQDFTRAYIDKIPE